MVKNCFELQENEPETVLWIDTIYIFVFHLHIFVHKHYRDSIIYHSFKSRKNANLTNHINERIFK